MASLAESQAFLDQFDKCLPLCERGDAVTVINALHTLNTITQASIGQALELDPAGGKDFVCSFLIELELALELFISPSKMLGTIDGGLPPLYKFADRQLDGLVDVPSPSTKEKVRRFLTALGVEPSSDFEQRGVAQSVKEFLKYQIEPDSGKCPTLPPASKVRENRSISWADQCSINSDCDSDVPPLDGEDALSDCESAEEDCATENSADTSDEEDEESASQRSAAAIFLWAAPVKAHETVISAEEPSVVTHSRRSSSDESLSTGSEQSSGKDGSRGKASRPVEPFFKTRKCKNWEQHGSCPFGDRCNFAHGDAELRSADAALLALAGGGKPPSSRRIQEGEAGAERVWDKRPNQGKSTGNYKTRMCKNWEQSGSCLFGDKCMFAHGAGELRRPLKTRQCTTFASTGKCPYGSECNFVHGSEEQA